MKKNKTKLATLRIDESVHLKFKEFCLRNELKLNGYAGKVLSEHVDQSKKICPDSLILKSNIILDKV